MPGSLAAAQGQDAGETARPRARTSATPRRVAESLWPDAELETASNNLYQIAAHHPAHDRPDFIALSDEWWGCAPPADSRVDVDLFEQAAAIAPQQRHRPRSNMRFSLWTGSLLPEDQYAEWALEHRERLGETHAAVATLLGAKLLEQGEPEAALALIEPLAAARPLDENLHRVLIDVLAGLGQRWEAIEAYERLRDALEEAYAAEPEPQTKALYRRLLTGPQKPERAAACNRSWGDSRNGSDCVSAWQRASVGESHLFLISGEAGIGKTRLAEELLTWADQQGIATARTRSYGAEGRLALAPVTEWLRSDAIRRSWVGWRDVWLTEIARLLPELLDRAASTCRDRSQ